MILACIPSLKFSRNSVRTVKIWRTMTSKLWGRAVSSSLTIAGDIMLSDLSFPRRVKNDAQKDVSVSEMSRANNTDMLSCTVVDGTAPIEVITKNEIKVDPITVLCPDFFVFYREFSPALYMN
jgi:hypothetical protein